ncbi:zinc finger, CCHC-type containing protein [Tanacetum coccineum]
MTTSVGNNSIFKSFFEKQKLTGPNFIDWYRQLRTCTVIKDKENYLEHPIPAAHVVLLGQQVLSGSCSSVHGQGAETMFAQQANRNFAAQREFHALRERRSQSTVSLALAVILFSLPGLREYDTLPKRDATPALHAIRAGRVQKNQKKKPHKAAKGNQRKGKAKMGNALVIGEGIVNLSSRVAEKEELSQGTSTLGIFTIELYSFPSKSWVYDTGYGHNLVYFSAIPRDGIYEIDLSSSNTNDSSMYAVSNKRAKLNLNYTLLWHCRLGHISKKRIEKLQHDGLLNSTDIKSFEKCVSAYLERCRKPYSDQVNGQKYLLGLVHPDVCGPILDCVKDTEQLLHLFY